MLKNLGEEIFKHLSLLKILGELYFKNNLIAEAEHIYKKIAEIDPNETEVIMKLGKVYLQREEFEKAYQLFLPTIDRFIEKEKYDEANSLLRFIITSNNTYLPALNKLASIFKATKKTSSLIAMYESLLPIYEQKKMHSELIAALKELIELSDSPFAYQEQLAKLTGESSDEDEEGKQEREFISFQLSNADQALKKNDFKKAIDLLKTAQNAFPQNTDIRIKLFDVYQMSNDIDALLNEGIELLQIYKKENNDEAYKVLSEKLTKLKPSDERLLDLGGHERTNIEIDFDHAEMIEQINELKHPGGMEEMESVELKSGGRGHISAQGRRQRPDQDRQRIEKGIVVPPGGTRFLHQRRLLRQRRKNPGPAAKGIPGKQGNRLPAGADKKIQGNACRTKPIPSTSRSEKRNRSRSPPPSPRKAISCRSLKIPRSASTWTTSC